MKVAFVFPGQGSQHVGMGKDLWERFEEVKALYNEASSALGYDLARLSFSGPEEELNKTVRTQPALVAASSAAAAALRLHGITPSVVAGHSLGEYSALVASNVISFADAVKLTEKRGAFMQEAVPAGKGLMAAILGLARKQVDQVCLSVRSGYVASANYNSPNQIVIAGETPAVEEAMKLAKEAGAKRALPLAVSAPSHCTLMAAASEKLSGVLDVMDFRDPAVPIVNNAAASFLTGSGEIKTSLVKQLNSPLLWEDSVHKISETGIKTFIEVGPGKVLSGLIKKIAPEAQVLNVEDTSSLNRTIEALSAAQ